MPETYLSTKMSRAQKHLRCSHDSGMPGYALCHGRHSHKVLLTQTGLRHHESETWLLIQPERKLLHCLKFSVHGTFGLDLTFSLSYENRIRRSGRASHGSKPLHKWSSKERFLSGLAHTAQSESKAVQRKHMPPSVAEQNCGNPAW